MSRRILISHVTSSSFHVATAQRIAHQCPVTEMSLGLRLSVPRLRDDPLCSSLNLPHRPRSIEILVNPPFHMLANHLARRAATCVRFCPPTRRAQSSTPPSHPAVDPNDPIGLPPPPHSVQANTPPTGIDAPQDTHNVEQLDNPEVILEEKPSVIQDRRRHPRRPIDFFPDLDEPDATTMAVTRVPVPNPNPNSSSVPRKRHPFNTYNFVTVLEKATVPNDTAKTLMIGTRQLINRRSERATTNMLSKEELENVSRCLFASGMLTLSGSVSLQGRVVQTSHRV